jgi:peptidoglycan/LPS O-acetylase OafA/YrhL
MNEQSQNNEPISRREARRQRRAQSQGGWIIGVILIILGGLFLMQNMGAYNFPITSWWALFILIPAIGAFERAVRYYRDANNQMTSQVSGSALVGLVLTLVTAGFIFNIGWTFFGPALIILAGLGILFNGMIGKKE